MLESVKEGVTGAGQAIMDTASAAKDYVTSKGEEATHRAEEQARAEEKEHYEEKAKDEDAGIMERGANALKAAGSAIQEKVARSEKESSHVAADKAKEGMKESV